MTRCMQLLCGPPPPNTGHMLQTVLYCCRKQPLCSKQLHDRKHGTLSVAPILLRGAPTAGATNTCMGNVHAPDCEQSAMQY
jgi:hypothetical protein